MKLLLILLVLFVSLAIVIPLLEKRAPQMSPEQQEKIRRWILPLVGLSLVLALLKEWVF